MKVPGSDTSSLWERWELIVMDMRLADYSSRKNGSSCGVVMVELIMRKVKWNAEDEDCGPSFFTNNVGLVSTIENRVWWHSDSPPGLKLVFGCGFDGDAERGGGELFAVKREWNGKEG